MPLPFSLVSDGNRRFVALGRTPVCGEKIKIILHIDRKNTVQFVIFSENVLDNGADTWYIIQARVGEICGFFTARNAMMREIASKGGNFRGVCPVIGRLNCFWKRLAYIAARMKNGSASVGHFSWLGMIRTAARTK